MSRLVSLVNQLTLYGFSLILGFIYFSRFQAETNALWDSDQKDRKGKGGKSRARMGLDTRG